MPSVRWVTAQRGSAWGPLDAAVRSRGQLGVVLVGPAGVGKTVLARAAARRYVSANPRAVSHWVSGTASASGVPFGAFSHLIEVAGVGEPATLLRAARISLCEQGAHGLLIAVDDAHHLDALSATMVHQLAVTRSARLILSVRSGEKVPDAITALWKDELLARVDIEPFSRPETTTLLEMVLGAPLETASANRIFTVSQGNPLYLRHLVEGAVTAGNLREVEGIWQLRGEFAFSPQLSTLIHQHLDAMPTAVQSVLQYLAVEEPLTLADLSALTSRDAVEKAEMIGAVSVRDRGHELVVHPAHPLYTEVVRARSGRLAARRLRTSLVAQLSARPREHLSDRLRLADLALGTDIPPEASDLIVWAFEAMRLGDLKLGERLARGALEQTGNLPARLPLAHSLSWQGRGRESDDVLSPLDPAGMADWDLTAWATHKAANQFWMLGESKEAIAFLDDTRSRVTEAAALHTIDALRATFAMNVGEPRRAIEIAEPALSSPDAQDLAVAWAAATATLSSARLGRFGDVERMAARGLAAQSPGLLRFTIGLGQTTMLIMAGELTAAEDLARRYLGFAEFQQPGRAIGEVLVAHTIMAKGAFVEATGLLREAAAALAHTGYSWGPLALIYLADVLGQRGEAAEAAKVLKRAEAGYQLRAEMYGPELGVAKAWTLAAARDLRGAVAAARDAARQAERTGQFAVALRALHDAVRLGDVGASDAIGRLCTEVDCAHSRLALRHARALAGRHASALDAVSVELGELGMYAIGADAAAQASALHAAAGERSAEVYANARAADFARRCGGLSTPALERVLSPLPLTGREREIAVMVSNGLTNKAIAQQLCVSVRTVEGHIYRACTKLDVPDRALLAVAVNAIKTCAGPPLPATP